MRSFSPRPFPFPGRTAKRHSFHPPMGPSDGKSLSDRLRSTSRQHPLQRLPDRQFHLSYPGFHHRRKAETSLRLLKEFLETLPLYPGETEPRYNLFAWTDRQGNYVAAYFHGQPIVRPAIRPKVTNVSWSAPEHWI